MVNTFQMFVSNNTFASLLLNIKISYDFRTFNTGCPDNSLCFHNVFLAECNTASSNFGDFRAGYNLYIQLAKTGFGFLNQFIRQDRQNLRSHISNDKTYFGRINKELSAQFFALFGHFSDQLDACKAGTDDNEGQHGTAYSRILFFSRFGVHIADLTFQRNGVVIGPEREGVLFSSGNTKEGWFASCTDNQVIICISSFIGFKLFALEINIADFIKHYIYFKTCKDFLQINLN
ncbi:hypothetical protein D3C74_300090 [compost metagenome]